jgi:hypothetical protein
MVKRVRTIILLAVLSLAVAPLYAQNVMEISYKDDTTPATMLTLTDVNRLWFANDMLLSSSKSAPAQLTQLALADIKSIKFKNSQTNIRHANVQTADDYVVFDMQGRQMLSTRAMSEINSLPRGIYIVRSNNKTFKISK